MTQRQRRPGWYRRGTGANDDPLGGGDGGGNSVARDRDWFVHDWNDTGRPYPKLLVHELLERAAAAKPDAIAVGHNSDALSYRALDARANHWARRLRALGIGPDRLVGVHLDRTPELISVLFGVLKAGGAYLPLDPAYPRERLEFIAADAAMSVLVTDDPSLSLRADGPVPVPVLTPAAVDEPDTPPPSRGPVVAANLAYVLYTSGSTGRPKGIAITHANAADLLGWAAEVFGSDLDRVLASTSICFDCSVLEIFGPLSRGGTVILADGPADLGDRLAGAQVRLVHTVPSIVADLLRTERLPATVRTAIVGGEALGPDLAQTMYERGRIRRLVNLYGPAECTSYASMAVVPRSPAAPPSIGRPVANTRIYLLDARGEPVAPGESGEIVIAGEGLARGYLHRPGLTAERFVPEPLSGRPGARMYRSGDLGRHDERGELGFLGRIDDQFKVRGVRVEPHEVERALLQHGAVRKAVVSARVDDAGRATLTAYVVPDATGAVRPETLRAFLNGKLPMALVPDLFVFLERLPTLPNGKTDRRRLPPVPPPGAAPPAAAPPAPTRTAWESVLATLWREALDTADIDADTELYELGGHSLAALRVKARLSALAGVDVPVRLLFERPTIAGLAEELEHRYGEPPRRGHGGTVAWPPRAADRGALSPVQRDILARADAAIDGPGLHLPVVVRLTGALNAAALARAIAALVARHRLLRSMITTSADGSPRFLAAHGPARGAVPLVDLRGIGPQLRADMARKVAVAMVERPLRVRSGPPLRTGLLRLADDDHVLVVVLHHIAGDAWSVETLCHQLLSAYSAMIAGRAPEISPVVQYADWAAEQQRRVASPAGRAQLRYWRSLLTDPPVLRLPGRTRRRHADGGVLHDVADVPGADVEGLGRLGRAEMATPYMVLTTAFAALLRHWTGQPDLMIGSPQAGRVQGELATVIGPCQDALPIRCDLSGDPTFRDALRRVRDRMLAAYANKDVPFVVLSEGRRGDPTRHPVYQASIVLQQPPSLLDPQYRELLYSQHAIGELRIGPFLEPPAGRTALDVEVMLFERDDKIEVVLEGRNDVLEFRDVQRMAADYAAILAAAHRRPDIPLSRLIAIATKSPAHGLPNCNEPSKMSDIRH